MSHPVALVLFAHGARDPRWAAPFQKLVELTRQAQPGLEVRLAFLELMEPRLAQVIPELAAAGYSRIRVVPVFLGQGGHVLRDLPEQLEQLRAKLPAVAIEVAQAVGEDAQVQQAMVRYCLQGLEGETG